VGNAIKIQTQNQILALSISITIAYTNAQPARHSQTGV